MEGTRLLWNYIAILVVAGGMIYFAIKTLTRFAVTGSFVKKELKAVWPDEVFEEANITIDEIQLSDIESQEKVREQMLFHIQARNSSGLVRNLELRSYDPAAEFEEEKYQQLTKNVRPKDDNMDASGASGGIGGSHFAGIEHAQSLLRDQAKIEKEDRIIRARMQRIKIDLEISRKLAPLCTFIPDIYRFNEKRACVMTEYTGKQSLTSYLETASHEQKMAIYQQIMRDLATAHNNFGSVSLFLPRRPAMDSNAYRSLLEKGLSELKKINILNDEQISNLLNEYYLISEYLADHYEAKLYFSTFSPYAFYINDHRALIRDWSNYDTGQMWFNIVELLKDPVSDLNLVEEDQLVQTYLEALNSDFSYEEARKLYDLSSCHILTVQLCYMRIYLERVADLSIEEKRVLKNWDEAHFNMLLTTALTKWSQYEESKPYAELLSNIFTVI